MPSVPPMDHDLLDAWDELHRANAVLRWYIGPTTCEERLEVPWSLYAFHPDRAAEGRHRSREWTATAPTEARCVGEMARCLREIG